MHADEAAWDRFVEDHPGGTCFQLRGWLDALASTYPALRPAHVTLRDGEGLVGLSPAFRVPNLLGGPRLTTLPYQFYGGPLGRSEHALEAVLAELLQRCHRVRVLDVRTAIALPEEIRSRHRLTPSDHYVRYAIPLGPDPDAVRARYARRFRERLRQLGRGGEREGLVVDRSASPDRVRAFHRVLVRAYRTRHGSLAHPLRFFTRLLSDPRIELRTLRRGPATLGGVVLARRGATTSYVFGAADPGEEAASPISRLLDDAVEEACRAGHVELDLGLTSVHHEGLVRFKRHLGAEPHSLHFYRRALRGALGPPPDYHRAHLRIRSVLRRLPVPVVTAAASALAGRLG